MHVSCDRTGSTSQHPGASSITNVLVLPSYWLTIAHQSFVLLFATCFT
jgi:hypothetical protein